MKKLRITCAVLSAILLAGCNNDMLEVTDATNDTFVASIESFENNSETKTSLSAKNAVVWNAGDQIAIFQGAPVVSKYEVDEACAGTSKGAFNLVQESSSQGEGFTSVMEIAANVAVYPYAQKLALSESSNDAEEHSYTIANVTVPANQKYLENSFSNGTFTMVAVTETAADKVLKFKNVMGAIKLQLLGDSKVKAIEIRGKNGEILCGNARITAYKGPYAPAITMLDEDATAVTLNCGEGVQLNPDSPTNFIIALPPTNFEEGFTVTVIDVDGKQKVMKTQSTNTVKRSYLLKMPELNISQMTDMGNIDYILFEDELVEELCINAFDTNNDGKLLFAEAAAVTDLGGVFNQTDIKTFDEFKYFTSVTSMPNYAFYKCESLTSITLPEGVTAIGEGAFTDCYSLTSITLPQGVTSIGETAFNKCKSLTSITIPERVTSIGDNTFNGCELLTIVRLPAGITSIGNYAFFGCKSLITITLPAGVTAIGNYVFHSCESLTSITLPEGITSIGYSTFVNCTSLTSITLPAGMTTIGDYTFGNCTSLTSITLPETVTSVGKRAFYYCESLTSITLPERVTSIGDGAFNNCGSLSTVTLQSPSLTTYGSYAFGGCSALTGIYVPATSVDTYKEGWPAYKTWIKAIQ